MTLTIQNNRLKLDVEHRWPLEALFLTQRAYVLRRLGLLSAATELESETVAICSTNLTNADLFIFAPSIWEFGASSNPAARNGLLAKKLALRAVELTQRRDLECLEMLAAAHAESGEFEAAIATQEEAISLTKGSEFKEKMQGNINGYWQKQLVEMEERIRDYRQKKAYKLPW